MVPVGKWRWIAGSAMVLLMIAACVFLLAQRRAKRFAGSSIVAVLPADGREHAVWGGAQPDGGPIEAGEITVESIEAQGGIDLGDARIVQAGNEVEVWMRAPVTTE